MRRLLLSLVVLCAMFIIGCGGAALIDAPEIDMVVMDTASVTIYWGVDSDIEGHADFQGYNVYVATDTATLMVEDGEDLNRINTDVITDSMFTVTGLSQDTLYYIQVRTVNTDDKVGSYNSTVPYVEASPRPVFTATVKFEIGTGPDADCAIRLSDAALFADIDMADSLADLWIDAWTAPNYDTISTASPSHHSQYGANANITYLANYGQHELDDVWEVTTEPADTTYVPIIEGDLVVVKTADNNYAKIHIDAIDDTVNYEVTITYAYQNLANVPFFGPRR